MQITPIKTDADHAAALREIEALWGAAEGTPDGDRLDILATLADAYEERRWPVADLDSVEAIEAAMAHDGHSRADLAELIGQITRIRSAQPQACAHLADDPPDRAALACAGTIAGQGICGDRLAGAFFEDPSNVGFRLKYAGRCTPRPTSTRSRSAPSPPRHAATAGPRRGRAPLSMRSASAGW